MASSCFSLRPSKFIWTLKDLRRTALSFPLNFCHGTILSLCFQNFQFWMKRDVFILWLGQCHWANEVLDFTLKMMFLLKIFITFLSPSSYSCPLNVYMHVRFQFSDSLSNKRGHLKFFILFYIAPIIYTLPLSCWRQNFLFCQKTTNKKTPFYLFWDHTQLYLEITPFKAWETIRGARDQAQGSNPRQAFWTL